MDVVVLVVAKHMALAKMVLRACIKGDYSPDLSGESRTSYMTWVKPWSLQKRFMD
jgi:hypothetical protein